MKKNYLSPQIWDLVSETYMRTANDIFDGKITHLLENLKKAKTGTAGKCLYYV